jgi:hypothetical protein
MGATTAADTKAGTSEAPPMAALSKVDGVPRVRQRDGGQAMTNALPITSSTGTVAGSASHVVSSLVS